MTTTTTTKRQQRICNKQQHFLFTHANNNNKDDGDHDHCHIHCCHCQRCAPNSVLRGCQQQQQHSKTAIFLFQHGASERKKESIHVPVKISVNHEKSKSLPTWFAMRVKWFGHLDAM
jgi:hypothetical protein